MKSKQEQELDLKDQPISDNLSSCQALKITVDQLTQQITHAQLQKISPTALAYLGDAIYELYVRMFFLMPPKRPEAYHRLVVAQVRAETQANTLQAIIPCLSSDELEIVRRGRNAATGRPKRLSPEIYQQATSLETLIGYLYLTDYQRLTELLQKAHLEK